MFLGKVIGKVVATKKYYKLEGGAFYIVQPLDQFEKPVDKPIVAIDFVHSHTGDIVYLVKSREAGMPWSIPGAPLDAGIVGIVDRIVNEEAL
ncbi:MAG: EutN/CcmL family microcompartment protein [Armatimonadota bacterium]